MMTFLAVLPPADGELLSSWITRNARANIYKWLHTYTNLLLPGHQVWPRDVDWFSDPSLVAAMARVTGIDLDRARQTTLASLAGTIYPLHQPNSRTPWIRPVGVYHRVRARTGLQFCPMCLGENECYWRLHWRLGFIALCPEHGVLLAEACPRCGRPANFHRVPLNRPLHTCDTCNFDLRHTSVPAASAPALAFQSYLIRVMNRGWAELGIYGPVHSVLFFAILRQLMRLIASGPAATGLRRALEDQYGIRVAAVEAGRGGRDIERLPPSARHDLLRASATLIENWPATFLKICGEEQVWASAVLKDWTDSAPVPFALAHAARFLGRSYYHPNEREVEAARSYLRRKTGAEPSARQLRLLTGRDSGLYSRSARYPSET
jgi:TniQ